MDAIRKKLGRRRGTKNIPDSKKAGPKLTVLGKPAIKIKVVTLNQFLPFGPQVAAIRIKMGYTRSAVARAINRNPHNLCNFEKSSNHIGQGIKTVFKYLSALGIKKVEFDLQLVKDATDNKIADVNSDG